MNNVQTREDIELDIYLEDVLAQSIRREQEQKEPRVKLLFKWFDLWVGVYIDTKKRFIYICPVPMIVVRIRY